MEKEIKVMEQITEKKIEKKEEENRTLFVEREKFVGNDKKEYFAYFVKGKVRNRDIKVDFAPKDKGGYEPLDIVFDISDKAELIMSEEEMSNDSGKTTKYTTYKVRTIDENGVVFECGVKPIRDSDKALLFMLINTMGINKN